MQCIVYHYNLIYVNAKNVSYEKDKSLVNYNKDPNSFFWNKLYLINMWKSVGGGNCWCKKFKVMEITKKRKNILPFIIIEFLGNQWPYNKIDLHTVPFLKT